MLKSLTIKNIDLGSIWSYSTTRSPKLIFMFIFYFTASWELTSYIITNPLTALNLLIPITYWKSYEVLFKKAFTWDCNKTLFFSNMSSRGLKTVFISFVMTSDSVEELLGFWTIVGEICSNGALIGYCESSILTT